MRDGEHHHVASATVVGSSARPITLLPLDHAEHGFDLPTLPVDGFIESSLHQVPTTTADRLRGGATMTRRNDRSDIDIVTAEFMVRF